VRKNGYIRILKLENTMNSMGGYSSMPAFRIHKQYLNRIFFIICRFTCKNSLVPQLKKLLFLPLIFLCCCSSSDKSEEQLFLENVMIRNCGLYVLMGSKPMCTFDIDNCYPETREDYELYFKKHYVGTEYETLYKLPLSNADFSKVYKEDMYLHTKRLWNAWVQKMNYLVGPRYRFVVRRAPFERNLEEGLFINIPNLLLTLKTYYQDFVECYGGPFNPQEVLDQISDIESPFWNKMFTCNYTQGLLLGYGQKNSFNFSWQMENKLNLPKISFSEQSIETLLKENLDTNDLQLPPISVYHLGDEVLEKYYREREQILQEFKRKDFVTVVKSWLLSEN
jgi:hypothetical protein